MRIRLQRCHKRLAPDPNSHHHPNHRHLERPTRRLSPKTRIEQIPRVLDTIITRLTEADNSISFTIIHRALELDTNTTTLFQPSAFQQRITNHLNISAQESSITNQSSSSSFITAMDIIESFRLKAITFTFQPHHPNSHHQELPAFTTQTFGPYNNNNWSPTSSSNWPTFNLSSRLSTEALILLPLITKLNLRLSEITSCDVST
ncbi:hypothetical protein QBC38DRAFT_455321 [Podospora fimiseda]|uniref:Uncharacterized protein n=1 Tax=Podospora fimiseda TaxID=252190 RepID=A0AAN7H2M6_9PEZI|nr:hypothetical protein QBC38DRAFT_455321 [Podospora fimiseda]